MAALAVLIAGSAWAQPGPAKNPGVTPQVGRIFPPDPAYEQCLRDKSAEMRLAESATNVVNLRERRAFWEGALKTNYTLRSRYPGGYEQMLAESFADYRGLGGASATVDTVRELPLPCVRPNQ
jgi:hypothetical protein